MLYFAATLHAFHDFGIYIILGLVFIAIIAISHWCRSIRLKTVSQQTTYMGQRTNDSNTQAVEINYVTNDEVYEEIDRVLENQNNQVNNLPENDTIEIEHLEPTGGQGYDEIYVNLFGSHC